jgi:protease YdgD
MAVPAAAGDPAREALPGIIGGDDRIPHEAGAWPWTAIGRLNRAGGGFCTGTLVGADVVLTAAHCLHDKRVRRRLAPKDLHFLAGYRRGDFVAHSRGQAIIAPEGADGGVAADDWALVVLEDAMPMPPIPVTTAAPFDPRRDADRGVAVVQAGYAQDRAHLLSVHAGCTLLEAGAGRTVLPHTCDTTHGASGSPLLEPRDGSIAVVAIAVAVAGRGADERGLAVAARAFLPVLDRHLAAAPPPR